MHTDIEFHSNRTICRGKLFEPKPKKGNGAGIVMAHGLCGTVDSGLMPYAKASADAGFHVLAFDYRGFGESAGAPRQLVSVPKQLEDWRAAIGFLRRHEGVDPTASACGAFRFPAAMSSGWRMMMRGCALWWRRCR